MDPVSAIGLASAIFQIITFTKGLILGSREIYANGKGCLDRNADIEYLAECFSTQLITLNKRVDHARRKLETDGWRKPLQDDTAALATVDDVDQLGKIAQDAGVIVQKLLATIQSLRPTNQGKREAMRVSFRSLLKQSEIADLEARLDRYRKQIDSSLLLSLQRGVAIARDEMEKNWEKDKKFDESIHGLEKKLDWLVRQQSSIFEFVLKEPRTPEVEPGSQKAQLMPPDKSTSTLTSLLSRENIPDEENLSKYKLSSSTAEVLLDHLAWGHGYQIKAVHLRQFLYFGNIDRREDAISEAYDNTFGWLYDDEIETPSAKDQNGESQQVTAIKRKVKMSIGAWLQSDQSLYWITGKPGAGKSTMMKYIHQNPRTIELATKWANGSVLRQDGAEPDVQSESVHEGDQHVPLFVAAYFFWNAGTEMQKLKEGLIRTLIYQLLEQMPEKLPDTFPDRWVQYQIIGTDNEALSWFELTRALSILLGLSDRRYLLIIDGLDEVAANGPEIADLIMSWTKFSSTKIITSSRPWTEFEDRFHGLPSLAVEDLTRSDILHYVTNKLGESIKFRDLQEINPEEGKRLITEIVQTASGVFLWVFVVVQLLLEGLQDGDDMNRLLMHTRSLPVELDEMFSVILFKQVKPAYSREASEILQYYMHSETDIKILPLFYAAYSLEEAISAEVQPLTMREERYHVDTMKRRLTSRCKCLLETWQAENPRGSEMRLLHRTVHDYLARQQTWNIIRDISSDYDPVAAQAISALLRIKATPTKLMDPRAGDLTTLARQARDGISSSTRYTPAQKKAFIAEVDRVMACLSEVSAKAYKQERRWWRRLKEALKE